MKKRLLALILSAAMMTESVLPVVAADDVEVTASENAAEEVAEEVAEDVVAEEEPAAEEAEEDAVVSESEVVTRESEEFFATAEYESYDIPADLQFEDAGEYEITTATSLTPVKTVYKGAFVNHNYTITDKATVMGKEYDVSTVISYRSSISYRARKIKPVDDLGASIKSSGLYTIVNNLTTISGTGLTASDVIKVKFVAKKNKNASSDAYFTATFSVKSGNAKKLGIKGKALSQLKKAVKQVNKVSKKKENGVTFTILPIDAQAFAERDELIEFALYRGWIIGTFQSFSHFRVRLEESQPATIDNDTYKQWTKVTKSDIGIKKVKGKERTYLITPKGQNFIGPEWVVSFPKTTMG